MWPNEILSSWQHSTAQFFLGFETKMEKSGLLLIRAQKEKKIQLL